jgi:hypothetical protein
MKKTTIGIVGLGMALGLGVVFAAPHAEAITLKKPAVHSASSTANYTFILGEDGAVWYTVTSTVGSATSSAVKTGNVNNVFETSNTKTTGFVATTGTTSLSSQCSSDTCSGIWAKTPGAGGFNDAPSISVGGPICNRVSDAAGAATQYTTVGATGPQTGILNILVPGLDKNVWYTLFDAGGDLGSSTTICGTSGTDISSASPFVAAGEKSNTGFVIQTGTNSLSTSCSDQAGTCVGIWAVMP